ncbi:hypothetical protein BGL34_04740 [Fructilactobacillus lindneri]|uniref:AbrB family transcriptional regulator n=2 Tax=Fructilactobacillus lindneri TaxID=53444 RepID=A0A0R2JS86_9LACO|nr:hypothetical protein [Fructilactobacillus lindneri]ANZ57554.1 hypothetical protein AYR60_01560 [Fructilactobacillus lindneri]ANZ58822.1 hypothetical protein AYR59_01560 [Fructilactobacillus lindneri]KRN78261.1 hypothetical protein IV52_GL001395 [Fructilactobacillus lindneri DSM 20690 = JCM 11027]POG97685.1 hypothetical protein BGL31_06195 [Fructilactobacillus lindneri]POH00072.1 hypothetical protein BGL32_04760 [Fructilactobacillus lindneri]
MAKKIVRATKHGDQVELPVTSEIRIDPDGEFYVSQTNEGDIIFTPIHRDIFSNPAYDDIDFAQTEVDIGGLIGSEKLDD